jgi:acyl-homoserine-lactone acylase
VLLALLAAAGCGSARSGARAGEELGPGAAADSLAPGQRLEILWDTWGIPHLFGRDAIALFYGFGWAQMRNHADLVLQLYGQARGRAAEYWGAEYLPTDRWVWTNGVPERAREWWGLQSPDIRSYVESFVEGINAYAREHPEAITDSLEVVLPVRPQDVLGHVQRVTYFTFVTNQNEVAGRARSWQEPNGSNAWAIAPARSASGNAMLLANPHLPWGDMFTFFEAQLTAPDVNVYGAALVGFPLPSIAFNDSLGWTHTVNTFDGADLFAIRLLDGGYSWDGVARAFETEEHVLKVKQPNGMAEDRLVVRRSLHGPIVAMTDSNALALRVVGLDQPHLLGQYWQMLRARNFMEFQTALSQLQLPMFTVMYADRQGHIMHVFNGQVPVRFGGDWAYWNGVVSGERSWTIWTQYHNYRDLPRVLDPRSGWLQNANDPPWTTTIPFPLDPANYPPYIAPKPSMSFRAQRSARMLAEDESITFEELVAYKHSTRVEAADHFLEDLIHAARTYGGSTARRAADVLERWDRQAEAGSRGTILFLAFMREMGRVEWQHGSPWDANWTAIAPLATPDGLSDPRAAAAALEAAATAVEQSYRQLDRPWGDVYRLQRDSLDLPANGARDGLGVFRVTGFEPTSDGRFRANSGDSYVSVIEFGSPIRARGLLTYGNASQPGSPHRTDQFALYARKELRDVWLTRDEIERNLFLRERF